MGRQKRDANHIPPKNNLTQNSEGNEEKGYPVPDSNKTKINYAKETKKPRRINRKKKSCK
jgi:hypothetical protein